jgi:hypothetical protein
MKEQDKTIKELVEEEIQKKILTYTHKFQHYVFNMEIHPDDSRDQMEKQMRKSHLD